MNNSGRGVSFMEGLAPFRPLVAAVGMFTFWALISPSDILYNQSRLFLTALGIVFSNITVRFLIATKF